ncbi:MAG: hypothetical protein IID17_09375, partial [Nitrospinae bacterium]|nr:hypothetical protein [Nitrospinota bacterium]
MYKVFQSAIVVTSPQNNPSIMTHQFLTEYGIAPSDWAIKSGLETPQISQVIWKNGLSITSNPGRIIFQFDLKNENPKPFERECLLGDIAEKYIGQLSKVKYTGIGINFSSVFDELKNAPEEFPKLFLSPKLARINNISPGQVKVSRKLNHHRILNLTINLGKYQGLEKDTDIENNPVGLLFKG